MSKPWQTYAEHLVDQALTIAIGQSPEYIRQIRPPRSVQMTPPEGQVSTKYANLDQVLAINRYAPTSRAAVSGTPIMTGVMSDHAWSGSARNSMTEGVF